MNYSHWDLQTTFTIYEASVLFLDIDVGDVDSSDWSLLRKIEVVARAICEEAHRDEIWYLDDFEASNPGIDLKRNHDNHIDIHTSHVTRDWLINYFNSKNKKPKFLSHEDKKSEGTTLIAIREGSTYQTDWINIQNAAIKEFFDPRRNPDAKRDEVVEWIRKAALKSGLLDSENLAAAIFTIIKPENHDPKKRRVEPQDSIAEPD